MTGKIAGAADLNLHYRELDAVDRAQPRLSAVLAAAWCADAAPRWISQLVEHR